MPNLTRRTFNVTFNLFLGLASVPGMVSAAGWRVTVSPPKALTSETPVVAEVSVPVPDGTYSLISESRKETMPAQVFTEAGKRYLAAILPSAEHRDSMRLKQETVKSTNPTRGIVLSPKGTHNLVVQFDQTPLSEYRTDTGAKPFFFPVIGPTGASYTRAYPMAQVPGEDRDHPHQRSFWFTHGKVNGIDFWSEQAGHGTIKETARKNVISGPVLGRLRTTDDWISPDGRKVCEDERIVTFYRTQVGRVIDFDITIKATSGPLTFGDTKEGMFGVRVASSMDVSKKTGGRITNAEGLTDEAAWGKASPWVDYTGPVEGKTVGVAILNHPRSFRFPTTWHVRTYGLFAANPFGWHDFGMKQSGDHTIPEGQEIRFGYRVILHEGATDSRGIKADFDGYADPPTVEIAEE